MRKQDHHPSRVRPSKAVQLDALRHLSHLDQGRNDRRTAETFSQIKGVEDSIEGTTVRAQVDSEKLRELIQVLATPVCAAWSVSPP